MLKNLYGSLNLVNIQNYLFENLKNIYKKFTKLYKNQNHENYIVYNKVEIEPPVILQALTAEIVSK
jgi:hypothetical protein